MADGLYVSEKVLKICKANGWDYIIRYKEGCAPLIKKEYEAIPEKNKAGKAEYVNEVIFRDTEQMEDRKSGIQPAEALAGEYRACMQLE